MASSSLKPQNSCQKLIISSLLLLSLILISFLFSLKLKTFSDPPTLLRNPTSVTIAHRWFDILGGNIGKNKKLKIGLVNVDDGLKSAYEMYELIQTVPVSFEPVPEDRKWEEFFPEWIDEQEKWGAQRCPEIPMPRLEDYQGLDVIMAKVPCRKRNETKGIRDVFRLQVNLVVANLVVANGRLKAGVDRTVYVVFIGDCGAMQEIFRCDDLVSHVGDYWVYKPELRRLKQKVLMPVGSCQIAHGSAVGGKEDWRYIKSQSRLSTHNQRVAYATVLHSSNAYVCGAISLAQSIIQSNSTHDLILLHDKSLTSKSLHGLRAAGWKTRLIQPIRSTFAKKDSYNEWNYSKLRIWQLVEYDKIIFIDADILVLKNLDKFFLYPQLSAAPNDMTKFNSGIMIIEPSQCVFEDLMSKRFKLQSYNGGDQGFLNEAFTWWHRLPSTLNFLKVFEMPRRRHQVPDDLYAIHFLGLKPWMCYRDYDCNWYKMDHHIFASDEAHRKWWQVYDAMPKKLQQYCGLTKQMEARIKKWRRGKVKNANLYVKQIN